MRVTAPTDASGRSSSVALQDALRIASLPPAASSRVIIVRHLDLGKVAGRVSSAALSTNIERRIRDAWQGAAHASSPSASTAEVVYFEDALEVLQEIAVRVAREGRVPDDWFWPLAVAESDTLGDWPSAFLLLLERATAGPAGPISGVRFVWGVTEALGFDMVARAVERHSVSSLHAALGSRAGQTDPSMAPNGVGQDRSVLSSEKATFLQRAVVRWGSARPHTLWYAAALVGAERPRMASSTGRLWAAAAHEIDRIQVPPPRHSPGTVEATETCQPTDIDVPLSSERLSGGDAAIRGGVESSFAGVLLLIRILDGLSIEALFEARPDIADGDWLGNLCGTVLRLAGASPEEVELIAPVWGASTHVESDRDLTALWLRSIRRLCREAGISWFAVVRRRGRVMLSPTHLDVEFRPTLVDIRVRRRGWDVDPGWVPWLGRVVSFHYAANVEER